MRFGRAYLIVLALSVFALKFDSGADDRAMLQPEIENIEALKAQIKETRNTLHDQFDSAVASVQSPIRGFWQWWKINRTVKRFRENRQLLDHLRKQMETRYEKLHARVQNSYRESAALWAEARAEQWPLSKLDALALKTRETWIVSQRLKRVVSLEEPPPESPQQPALSQLNLTWEDWATLSFTFALLVGASLVVFKRYHRRIEIDLMFKKSGD